MNLPTNNFAADEKLILMTSTFDVVSETTLHPSDFGEGALLKYLIYVF